MTPLLAAHLAAAVAAGLVTFVVFGLIVRRALRQSDQDRARYRAWCAEQAIKDAAHQERQRQHARELRAIKARTAEIRRATAANYRRAAILRRGR